MPVIVRTRLRRFRLKRIAFARLAQELLDRLGQAQAEVGVELVGDRRMRQLNWMYRAKPTITDVLAFPMREGPGPRTSLLGDVVISLPEAARRARKSKSSLDVEVAVLLIHGVLHLCGYDHEKGPEEARRMSRRETSLLRELSPIASFL